MVADYQAICMHYSSSLCHPLRITRVIMSQSRLQIPTFRLEDDLLGGVSVELVGGVLALIRGDHLAEEADVTDRQAQSVHLRRSRGAVKGHPAERRPQPAEES